MSTTIVWFRNDLRLHDHPALSAAVQGGGSVVPLFILDGKLLEGRHGSANRNRFLMESLYDLCTSLRARGADLVVRTGQPVEVLRSVAAETGATAVHYTIDYTPYARARDSAVTAAFADDGVTLQAFPGRLAVDSFEGVYAKNGNTYTVFTPFWKNWATIDRRNVLPAPDKITLASAATGTAGSDPGEIPDLAAGTKAEDLSTDVLTGGETAGRERMARFLEEGILRYDEMHDTLTPDGTSRLSAYLHFGCVSVRELEDSLPYEGAQTDGPARFHRQLAWRDFYNYVLLHYPDNSKLEFQERFRGMEWSYDEGLLRAWQEGRTGYPIIDAAMRQLRHEGWMHNRARLIVGSFLTKDLQLDWRLGERYFMRMLMDGDEANNNGNWQWIASVGVDPAPVFRRLYNPMTQQLRYDSDGSYVRYYVPELAKVPDRYIAEPWKMPADVQTEAGCRIGDGPDCDYPPPIVDHATARLTTLERFRAQSA
ncbi:MAG TPA: deoxyribodipyrimidine photo-lyase [Candidatus Saccharimonadales bacterium]|jgi:deoxyribodipyrimidine photo-lyase